MNNVLVRIRSRLGGADLKTPDIDIIDEHGLPPTEDKFCHIEIGDARTAYCGKVLGGPGTCKIFDGEAICPTCGRPTCPSCAVMSDLNERLIGDEDDAP